MDFDDPSTIPLNSGAVAAHTATLRKLFHRQPGEEGAVTITRQVEAKPGATFANSAGRGYRVAPDGSVRRLDKPLRHQRGNRRRQDRQLPSRDGA